MISDRIFGLVALFVALAYIASATQIQTSFLADPVGPKAFPILIGVVASLCCIVMIVRPDPDPDWPVGSTWISLLVAVLVLVAYAYALKPLGFIVPTAIAAGILSYQISPRPVAAAISGIALAFGLFALFKFCLDLGLVGVSKKAAPYLPFIQPIVDAMGWAFDQLFAAIRAVVELFAGEPTDGAT